MGPHVGTPGGVPHERLLSHGDRSEAGQRRHRTASTNGRQVDRSLLPLPWPAGIATRPEVDQQYGGTEPVAFVADVAELEELVELITAPIEDLPWPSHPIFGPMSKSAWLRWSYLHMDHHLRQFGA